VLPDFTRPPVATALSGVSCRSTALCMAVGLTVNRPASEMWDGTSWHGLATPGPAHVVDLAGVSCASRTRCMAIGGARAAHPFALSWNGQRWRLTAVAPLAGTLHGISCPDPARCVAVGHPATESAAATAEMWDSGTWSVLPMQAVPGAVKASLSAVSCTSGTSCMAVGSYASSAPGNSVLPLAETWDGTNWQVLTTPSLGSAAGELNGIWCTGGSGCIAVGSEHTASSLSPLIERWDGKSWSVLTAAIPAGAGSLASVSCASATSCMAVGSTGSSSGTLTERWDGVAWKLIAAPDPMRDGNWLASVSCAVADGCMAVGSGYLSAGLINGESLSEQWDGIRWQLRRSGQIDVLADVSCPSAARCMAVGRYINRSDRGVTLAESWNGRRWVQRTTPNPPAPSDGFIDVSCTGPAFCLAIGGVAEKWNGTRWLAIHAPPVGLPARVSCSSATRCIAVGGAAAAEWNGQRWRAVPPANHRGVFSLDDVSCPAATMCMAVGISASKTGPPHSLAEEWNGKHWRVLATPNMRVSYLNGVDCSGQSRCMAVGWAGPGAGGLAELWNGRMWRAQKHLVPADYPGLRDVACPGATRCVAVGIDATERWNGRTWKRVQPAGHGVALLGVACARPGSCIAVGQQGTLTIAEQWNGTRWLRLRSRNP
jgi:hypothetical protein